MARLFVIPPGAFRPVPKVDSAFARLEPLGAAKPVIANAALFARIVAAAFGQRRKTLRNALASICNEGPMRALWIDPGARGEALAVSEYIRLANQLAACNDGRDPIAS
jgi:16S rRNA (adenine1518-N6/adenine1519-N6)-dimethyltransferase